MSMKFLLIILFLCTVAHADICDKNYVDIRRDTKSFFQHIYPKLKDKYQLGPSQLADIQYISSEFKTLFPARKRVHAVLKSSLLFLDKTNISEVVKKLKKSKDKQSFFNPLIQLYKTQPPVLEFKLPEEIDINSLKQGDIIALSTRKGATAFLSNTISHSLYDHIAIVGADGNEAFVYNFNLRRKHHKLPITDFIKSNSANGFVYSVFRPTQPLSRDLQTAWSQVESGQREIESCAQLTNYLLEESGVAIDATDLLSGRNLKDEPFGDFLETVSKEIIEIRQERFFPQSILDSNKLVQTQGLEFEELNTLNNISLWLHAGDTRRIAKKFFLNYLKTTPLPKDFDFAFRGYLIFQYRLQLFKNHFEN